MSGEFDDLLPVFYEESREHVETLNLALLTLERHGDDTEAMHDAFRAAHSLKGMSATMGFNGMARLTHGLENVLENIRMRTSDMNRETVSLLLRASDGLMRLLVEIEKEGEEKSSVDDLCALLQNVVQHAASEENLVVLEEAGPDAERCAQYEQSGMLVYSIEVKVSSRSLMPGARAYASLLSIESLGAVLGSRPSREILESGLYDGRTATVWLASDRTMDAVRDAGSTPEIDGVVVHLHKPDLELAREAGIPELRPSLQRARTVRVDASRLDDLMHGVGELLVHRARVQNLVQQLHDRDLSDAVDSLDRVARDLQALVMDVRMVSIDSVFRRLPRLVRDLGDKLVKDVRLNITGQETELDRTVIDVLGDPLVHLVRNAIDHGIEDPDVREAAGKPRTGLLDISATTEAGAVMIRIRDDGAGMQPDRIREAAVRRGVIGREEANSLADDQALDLCFAPGFSTRSVTTDVSGRGVGLDVVRASVRALGGDVSVESSDEGTIMSIRLPLTLAIRSVLLMRVGTEIYAIHTDRVGQTVDLDQHEVQLVAGCPALVHLDRIIPLIDLNDLLVGEPSGKIRSRKVVMLESGENVVGAMVDDVIGQAEVVTRSLPAAVRASSLLSASAVLGDGEVAFLINADALVSHVERGGALSVVA